MRQGAECTVRCEPTGGRGARCVTPTADRKAETPPETRGSCPFCRGNGGGERTRGTRWVEPLRTWSAARPRPGRQTQGEVESQLRLGPNSGFSRKLEKFILFNFCSRSRLFCCRCSHVIRKKGVTVFSYCSGLICIRLSRTRRIWGGSL